MLKMRSIMWIEKSWTKICQVYRSREDFKIFVYRPRNWKKWIVHSEADCMSRRSLSFYYCFSVQCETLLLCTHIPCDFLYHCSEGRGTEEEGKLKSLDLQFVDIYFSLSYLTSANGRVEGPLTDRNPMNAREKVTWKVGMTVAWFPLYQIFV